MSPDDFSFSNGVAIDAGSSGSRIYLYRWAERDPHSFARVEREAVFSDERTPGIGDERGLGLLEELVLLAKDSLPADVEPRDVPIYLGATAGMRIVDSEFEADVMIAVRSLLRGSGFMFRDDWARTISGKEEGAYDWLVANYLKNEGDLPASSATYGALDLGGASAQISFPVPSASAADDRLPLRIDRVEYPLFTQSFLYYGVDQARGQYDAKFASATKINPCYPAGYTDPDSNVSGTSNWEECLHNVAVFFDQNPSCHRRDKGRCLIGGMGRHLIDKDQKFIAMSAFVYTWDFLNLKIGKNTDDLSALNDKARHICNMTHKQQLTRYQRRVENGLQERSTAKPHVHCFNAAFSYHLLSKGYGMPVSQTPIEIYHDIHGTKVQWALGLMLVEANRLGSIFREVGQRQQFNNIGMGNMYKHLFMISIAVLFTITWVLGYFPCRLKRASSDGESCLPLIDPNAIVQNLSPRKGR